MRSLKALQTCLFRCIGQTALKRFNDIVTITVVNSDRFSLN